MNNKESACTIPNIKTICFNHMSAQQEYHMTMITAEPDDTWRSDNLIEQSMGADSRDEVDFLKNKYTWFKLGTYERGSCDITLATQACAQAEEDSRMIMIVCKTLAEETILRHKNKKQSQKIRIEIIANFKTSTLQIHHHTWKDMIKTSKNDRPMSLIIIEKGTTIPIHWPTVRTAIKKEIPQAECPKFTKDEWDYRPQPIARSYRRRNRKNYPGLEYLHKMADIQKYMSKDAMANWTLEMLGIHEPSLRKKLKTSGHIETEYTPQTINTIREKSIKTVKKAFKRDRDYQWKEHRQFKMQKGANPNRFKKIMITINELPKKRKAPPTNNLFKHWKRRAISNTISQESPTPTTPPHIPQDIIMHSHPPPKIPPQPPPPPKIPP